MWTYVIESGALIAPDGKQVAKGYSGNGIYKNKPEFCYLKDLGPIPVGLYHIGGPYNSEHVGAYALPLDPYPTNEMFGRGDFRCHGDSISAPGTASHGCIIFTRMIRVLLGTSQDRTLKVIAYENQIAQQ